MHDTPKLETSNERANLLRGALLQLSLACFGLDYEEYWVIDENLYRRSAVNILQGNASKAKKKLAWSPEVSLNELVREMVEGDLDWYSNYQNL
jgi:GDPmannose 4,6-dehydratase